MPNSNTVPDRIRLHIYIYKWDYSFKEEKFDTCISWFFISVFSYLLGFFHICLFQLSWWILVTILQTMQNLISINGYFKEWWKLQQLNYILDKNKQTNNKKIYFLSWISKQSNYLNIVSKDNLLVKIIPFTLCICRRTRHMLKERFQTWCLVPVRNKS